MSDPERVVVLRLVESLSSTGITRRCWLDILLYRERQQYISLCTYVRAVMIRSSDAEFLVEMRQIFQSQMCRWQPPAGVSREGSTVE